MTPIRSSAALIVALVFLVGIGCADDPVATDSGAAPDSNVAGDGGGGDAAGDADASAPSDSGPAGDSAMGSDVGPSDSAVPDSTSGADSGSAMDSSIVVVDSGPGDTGTGADTSDSGPPVDPCGTSSAVWARRFGTGGYDQITAGATTSTGTSVVAGRSRNGTIDFGGGPIGLPSGTVLTVAQLSASGAHMWSDSYGAGFNSRSFDVAIDALGNVFITGEVQGTVDFGGGALPSVSGGTGTTLESFIASFDSTGAHRWSRRFGPGDGVAVVPSGAGGAVMTGRFNGAVDFGGTMLTSSGTSDVFLVTLGATGTVTEARQFGGTGTDWAGALAIDGTGAIVMAGHHGGGIDFGGGSVSATSGMYLAKLDAARAHVWSHSHSGNHQPNSLAIGPGSAIFLGGQAYDLTLSGWLRDGAFVAKLDASGVHRWSQDMTLAPPAGDFSYVTSVAVDASGDVVATGGTTVRFEIGGCTTPDSGAGDAFLVRMAGLDGVLLTARMIGAPTNQSGRFVGAALGSYFVGGYLGDSSIDLGTGPLASGGDFDGFLVRYTP